MRVYAAETSIGRKRSIDDIHHKTRDCQKVAADATAKAQRKAARQQAKRLIVVAALNN